MINKIIDSIAFAIHEEFGDVDIYTDSVEQGLEYPCFFVFCVAPTINLHMGRRYERTNKFVIQYMSDDITQKYDVMERLFNILEMIDVDGKLFRGTDINSSFEGDILNFTLNYDMFVYLEQSGYAMETLEQKTVV
jgi:hypothetical protein